MMHGPVVGVFVWFRSAHRLSFVGGFEVGPRTVLLLATGLQGAPRGDTPVLAAREVGKRRLFFVPVCVGGVCGWV